MVGEGLDASDLVAEGDARELDINHLSNLSGQSVRNLRAYLQLGVLHPAVKRGRMLIFDDSHVRRLEEVARLQDLGYSLAAIRDVLSSAHPAPTHDNVEMISRLVESWLGSAPPDFELSSGVFDRSRPGADARLHGRPLLRLGHDGAEFGHAELSEAVEELIEHSISYPEVLEGIQDLSGSLEQLAKDLVKHRFWTDQNGLVDRDRVRELWAPVLLVVGSLLTHGQFQAVGDGDQSESLKPSSV